MTKYTKQIEYVVCDWDNIKTIKPSETKKIKLENQGYTHIKSWVEYPDRWISKYEYKKNKQLELN